MVKLSRPRPVIHDYTAERLGKPCKCPACLEIARQRGACATASENAVVNFPTETQKGQASPAPKLAQRLIEAFGLGDDDARRLALYVRLELMVERLGWRVEVLIQEAAMMSEGRRDAGRYFARSIVLKLRESGVYSWAK